NSSSVTCEESIRILSVPPIRNYRIHPGSWNRSSSVVHCFLSDMHVGQTGPWLSSAALRYCCASTRSALGSKRRYLRLISGLLREGAGAAQGRSSGPLRRFPAFNRQTTTAPADGLSRNLLGLDTRWSMTRAPCQGRPKSLVGGGAALGGK